MTSEKDRIRGFRGKPSAEPAPDPRRDGPSMQPRRRGQSMEPDSPVEEAIIEFYNQGGYVRVCAIDVATGTEAAIVGDPVVGERALKRLALRKLEYILSAKKRGL